MRIFLVTVSQPLLRFINLCLLLCSLDDSDERVLQRLEGALKPVRDQTRSIEDRLGRIQHTLDQLNRSQRERDSNSNLNRDMVLLVILVVMIQAVLNWILSARAHQAAQFGATGSGAGSGSSNGL